MTQSAEADRANAPEPAKGVYVYGILPGDIEMTGDRAGVGDPPGQVRVVRSGKLAALVSDIDPTRPLGTPDDLRAHKAILDDSATDVPVLPMRFGAVLTSEDAVIDELLAPNDKGFSAALDDLEDRREYVLKGRYVERAVLESALSQNKDAARLAEEIRRGDPDATRETRILFGQLISQLVADQRARDTQAVQDAMAKHCVASVVREPTHELDAVHIAYLLESGQEEHLEQVVRQLGEDWKGLIELEIHGPQAAYDFVGLAPPGGTA
jgi:Gas vesicle synthesis protein GvpL/GvpF